MNPSATAWRGEDSDRTREGIPPRGWQVLALTAYDTYGIREAVFEAGGRVFREAPRFQPARKSYRPPPAQAAGLKPSSQASGLTLVLEPALPDLFQSHGRSIGIALWSRGFTSGWRIIAGDASPAATDCVSFQPRGSTV